MSSKTPKRCHHCGREVGETRHTRSSYKVGYYDLHGGDVEMVTKVRPEEEGGTMTILRLVHPTEFYTCGECYGLPAVVGEREHLFRPELEGDDQSPLD